MGALAASAMWTGEDDFRLKSAVERGASLEALAKGVVQFSHRFTLKEIQDRWIALLFDTQISAESSARMLEFEDEPSVPILPKASKLCSNKGKDTASRKRKIQSVRDQYYAMRKRRCHEPCYTNNTGFIMESCSCSIIGKACTCSQNVGPNLSAQNLNYYGHYSADDFYSNEVNLPNCTVASCLDEVGYESTDRNNVNIPYPVPAVNMNQGVCSSTGLSILGIHAATPALEQGLLGLGQGNMIEAVKCAGSTIEGDVDERSVDAGFSPVENLMDMDDIFFDADGKDEPSPCELNDILDPLQDPSSLVDAKLTNNVELYREVPNFLDSLDDEVLYNQINTNYDVDTEPHVCGNIQPLTLSESHHANSTGKVSCVINTHDTEVPENDDPADTVLEAVCPISVHDAISDSLLCSDTIDDSNLNTLLSAQSNLNSSSSGLEQMTGLILPNDSPIVRAGSSDGSFECGPLVISSVDKLNSSTLELASLRPTQNNPCAENCGATKYLGHQDRFNIPRDACKENENLPPNSALCFAGVPNGLKHELIAQTALQICVPLEGAANIEFQGPVETAVDEDEQTYDSEDDVPSFSDIEAMIFDTDLIPYDQDSDFFSREAAQLQLPETKRTIARLEQAAQAYMNRDILSRGALAVLYGRQLKYFIKDAEVTLGRETEDVKVDIDLSKEGRANKVSRQQAVIKLDDDEVFHIKNIGKCPIFVNGKEVPPRKRINLRSDCLIEIRDLRFIFHVNERAVKQYVNNAKSRIQNQLMIL